MKKMPNNTEYYSLLWQRSTHQNDYYSCSDRIKDYRSKISTLKKKKDEISTLWNDLDVPRTDVVSLRDTTSSLWKGSTCTALVPLVEEVVTENNNYADAVSKVLDDIDAEIQRLQDLKEDELSSLVWLEEKIASLTTLIDNLAD